MSAALADADREVRVEVEPLWHYRLPRRSTMDGLTRRHGSVLHRLLHVEGPGDPPTRDHAVHVRVAQLTSGRVLIGGRARYAEHAATAIARMRAALGVDHDLRAFHREFRSDPLIGRALREDPGLRVAGRPDPFEALAWAITEQLIEYERAVAIQRRMIAKLGSRCAVTGLRDSPPAAVLAAQAPALLQSLDLSAGRAIALRRAALEVSRGRVDLHDPDHESGWRRLRAIPGIGAWTIEMLALTGQGRLDQLPAGDVGFLKLVGRLRSGDPHHRATEQEVRDLFEPYGRWKGLAGSYALRVGGRVKNAVALT